jgi:transcriptional regulator with XRE-family HTH domain
MQPKTKGGFKSLNPLQIRQELSLSRENMGRLVQASAKTLERWEKGQATPSAEAMQRLAKLHEIVNLGLTVYTSEGFKEFLKTPLNAFDGHSASQLMSIGQYDRVIAVLAADYEGQGY